MHSYRHCGSYLVFHGSFFLPPCPGFLGIGVTVASMFFANFRFLRFALLAVDALAMV